MITPDASAAATSIGAMLSSGVKLASANEDSEIISGFEAIKASVFLDNSVPAAADAFEAICQVRWFGSIYDLDNLDDIKGELLKNARPRIDEAASRFASMPCDATILRANGFESRGHFADIVVRGREMGIISIPPAEAMVKSVNAMFAEHDLEQLLEAVARPTNAEKREALIENLTSPRLNILILGIIALHGSTWVGACVSGVMLGFTNEITLVMLVVATICLPFLPKHIMKAVDIFKEGMNLAGRPDEMEEFFNS